MLFYAVHFAAQTWDPFKGLSRLTLFNYYLPQDAINLGRVDLASIAVLLGVALIGTIAAAVIFRLRDLSL